MEPRTPVELTFKDITTLDEPEALEVLAIRNQPMVRKNMYTDHLINPDEHFGWIGRLKGASHTKFFAVLTDGKIIGGVSISGIDERHKRADWAFYLSEDCQGKGIGSALERQFVTMAFEKFGIEKLNCEVISFNDRVVKLHQKFGFQIEGTRREHVIRDGEKFDAVFLGITKDEWFAKAAV